MKSMNVLAPLLAPFLADLKASGRPNRSTALYSSDIDYSYKGRHLNTLLPSVINSFELLSLLITRAGPFQIPYFFLSFDTYR